MEEERLLNGSDCRLATRLQNIKEVFFVETKKLWQIGGLIVFNVLCAYGIDLVTIIFSGHLGDLELSVVTLSQTVIGNFIFGFLLGMGSALETLCGQAYGAGEISMMGIYLQRSWIILVSTSVFLLPLSIFASPALKLLGQEAKIAELSGMYTVLIIPRTFSLAIIFPTQKFLQAQNKVVELAWIGFAGLIVHVPLTWLLVFPLNLGLIGCAVAYDITILLIAILQALFVFTLKDAWKGFSWLAFKDLWGFVRLSLESAVMLCLEVWYFMSLFIVTGNLNNSEIAIDALSICVNISGILAMLFIGINAAISIRVSNELGRGNPRAAKYSVYVTVFQSCIIGLFFMTCVLVARDKFPVIFTNSKAVQTAASKLAFLLGICIVLGSVQFVLSGVAVGGGWQATVAYINVGCYYIFGLPLGILLGYTANLGVAGIWGGMITGTALQAVLLLIIVYKTDWEKEVEQSAERMRKWGGQEPAHPTADT